MYSNLEKATSIQIVVFISSNSTLNAKKYAELKSEVRC